MITKVRSIWARRYVIARHIVISALALSIGYLAVIWPADLDGVLKGFTTVALSTVAGIVFTLATLSLREDWDNKFEPLATLKIESHVFSINRGVHLDELRSICAKRQIPVRIRTYGHNIELGFLSDDDAMLIRLSI